MTTLVRADEALFGKRLWLSGLVALLGFGVIALTIYLNVSTLFDHNGKGDGTEELTVLEGVVVLESLLFGFVAGALFRSAMRARAPGAFRWMHLLPVGAVITAIAIAILALVSAVLQIVL